MSTITDENGIIWNWNSYGGVWYFKSNISGSMSFAENYSAQTGYSLPTTGYTPEGIIYYYENNTWRPSLVDPLPQNGTFHPVYPGYTYQNGALTTILLTPNSTLKAFYCINGSLTSLDVSGCAALTDFTVANHMADTHYTAINYLDLETMPDAWDATKASAWQGAVLDGKNLIFDSVSDNLTTVSYTYDCGNGYTATFSLGVSVTTGLRIAQIVLPQNITATPTLALTPVDPSAEAPTLTQLNGQYIFACSAPGEYLLTVEAKGCAPYVMNLMITETQIVFPRITLTHLGDLDTSGEITSRDVNLLLAILAGLG